MQIALEVFNAPARFWGRNPAVKLSQFELGWQTEQSTPLSKEEQQKQDIERSQAMWKGIVFAAKPRPPGQQSRP
jgi:hypothetical protein